MKNKKFKSNFSGQFSKVEEKPKKSLVSTKRFKEIDLLINKEMSFDQGTHIVEFLKSRPFLSISKVEKSAEIPKSSLLAAMSGKRNVPMQYWYRLNNVLCDYGYSLGDAVQADPPELYLPFKYLDISVHESGVHFSKNYEEIEDVKTFLNNVSVALDYCLKSEITKYGKEFVLNSRILNNEDIL